MGGGYGGMDGMGNMGGYGGRDMGPMGRMGGMANAPLILTRAFTDLFQGFFFFLTAYFCVLLSRHVPLWYGNGSRFWPK